MLKIIAVTALIIQSYLVTDAENKRLNSSDYAVFKWLREILDHSVRGVIWNGKIFAVDVVIRVMSFHFVLLS